MSRPRWKPQRRHHGLVVFPDELGAKIALAGRVARDKGEIRYFKCGNHFHLTSQPKEEVN